MSGEATVISEELEAPPQSGDFPRLKPKDLLRPAEIKSPIKELPNIPLTSDQFREAQRKLRASEDLADKLSHPSKEGAEILALKERITIDLSEYRPQYCSVTYGDSLMLQRFDEEVVRFVKKTDLGKTKSLQIDGQEFLLNARLFNNRINAQTLKYSNDDRILTIVPIINVTTEGAKEIVSYSGLLVFQETKAPFLQAA